MSAVSVRKLVYVAGPLSSDQRLGLHEACKAGDALLAVGVAPLVPHLSVAWAGETVAGSSRPYAAWMDLCFEWLRRCDAVLRLPGYSEGSDREVALAESLSIPVFRTVEEVCRWVKEGECADFSGHGGPSVPECGGDGSVRCVVCRRHCSEVLRDREG